MKPADVISNIYLNSSKEINNKDPKFKIGDIVRISKYKNIFGKRYVPIWSEEVLVIIKVKNTVSYYQFKIKAKKLLECFIKNNCKKQTKESLHLEK